MNTSVDLSWHAPISSSINSLSSAINGTGTYGFVFDSSTLPEGTAYGTMTLVLFSNLVAHIYSGTYNWCNMPHVRRTEYRKVNSSYGLEYVEVIHRHHKRTPYADNTFPVESYPWYCDDEGLFFYGAPLPTHGANHSANTYWTVYTSPSNPLAPRGFNGTCQFPQITREGLDDSWQHGKDLYGVYHDLLGFLPKKYDPKLVSFRVTNNVITSQVASMVTSGMFGREGHQNLPLSIQPASIDSLEPAYTCSAASEKFSEYGAGSSDPSWTSHLKAASDLFANLDTISGVLPTDSGFHKSFDHYFDNLSARLCHAKPLPCNISNPSLCVTREMADEVFRLGQYEYSYLYRDAGTRTLEYSTGRYGIWAAELAQNLRDAMHASGSASTDNGRTSSGIKYRHNVAHDGSVSNILSILQIEKMVWPGMGSELVFELYKRKLDQQYYIRVLWGGQVLKSSNPTLGALDMIRVEILVAYFDGLVGRGAKKIPSLCSL
ncbi:hypothetical protein V498_01672 [Pseudogymnoascus sp. VKM F-4517 (FW-2822)]|nr:hypothetical protein V498_01672 [Pseudogymnoascus sp. VKM F-4517 (FW-2822)]